MSGADDIHVGVYRNLWIKHDLCLPPQRVLAGKMGLVSAPSHLENSIDMITIRGSLQIDCLPVSRVVSWGPVSLLAFLLYGAGSSHSGFCEANSPWSKYVICLAPQRVLAGQLGLVSPLQSCSMGSCQPGCIPGVWGWWFTLWLL